MKQTAENLLRSANYLPMPAPGKEAKPILITGGAGFVGCNLADRLCSMGLPVLLFDNLHRAGVERNLQWLREQHGNLVQHIKGDIRDAGAVRSAVSQAGQVFHFAAQVAVTTSLVDPIEDFQINAGGTLNLLEAIRAQDTPPPVVFTSTNKVYGALDDVAVRKNGCRYEPVDAAIRAQGIEEGRPLDFHSPYGCSKGAADQYVQDYARSYGLPSVVFRMSCIYGAHQFGTEDQGWVAHFLIRALQGLPITLYGDGLQVRDILYVDDLVDALLLAQTNMPQLSGQAFNIGGGTNNTTSLMELMKRIGILRGEEPDFHFEDWRTGDQKYYVSNINRFQSATGWKPRIGVQEGVERLHRWLCENRLRPETLRRTAEAMTGAAR